MDITAVDNNMIEKCINGDSLSWRELVDGYINLVYNAAYNTIAKHSHYIDRYDIDDISQNVFMNLFANDCRVLKMYDADKAKFSTWLTIIARNSAIDYIRKKKALTVSLDETIEVIQCTTSVEPDDIDIPHDVITSRQHLVLRMMYDDRLDVVEIAFFLGVKRQTVRSLHHRALTKLREYYGLKAPAQRTLRVVNNNE